MDFSVILPALVGWGPPGIVIAILMWMLHGRDVALKEAHDSLRNEWSARLADNRTALEARVADNREFQRVVTESTNATVRVTQALESVTVTLREVVEADRIEREIARREASRERTP